MIAGTICYWVFRRDLLVDLSGVNFVDNPPRNDWGFSLIWLPVVFFSSLEHSVFSMSEFTSRVYTYSLSGSCPFIVSPFGGTPMGSLCGTTLSEFWPSTMRCFRVFFC